MEGISVTKNENLEYVYQKNLGINWTLAWKKNPGAMYEKLREQKWHEFEIINRFVKFNPSHVVLDYGIGIGLIAECVSKVVGKVYGWDIDPLMLDYCRERYKDITNLELLPIDCPIADLESLKINIIMANHVFCEYYSPSEFTELLSRFSKILPSGGLVWFDWYNKDHRKIEGFGNVKTYSVDQVNQTIDGVGDFKTIFVSRHRFECCALIKRI
jgi:SAM-dependent methyltransferase